MPNEYRDDDAPRSPRDPSKTESDIEVSRSRYHAQQAIALVADGYPNTAAVHATLSNAAATRASVLAYQEEEGT